MKEHVFRVNIESPVPVYVQLEQQIQYRIAAGAYKAGDQLPSVREMSEQAGVNANTVSKVYRDLLLMGLIHTRRGVGVTVTADAAKLCRERSRTAAKTILREAALACLSAGVSGQDIIKIAAKAAEGRPEEG
jgi:GntR family transcriptional regulator